MKKLELQLGGHPRTNNDLQHLSEMLAEVNQALGHLLNRGTPILNSRTEPSIVLTGCIITDAGATFSVTAGLLWHEAEVFICDAQTAVPKSGSGSFSWVLDETYIAENPVLYADGNPKNVHKIRKRRVVYDAIVIAGEIEDAGLRRPDFDWIAVGGGAGAPAFTNGWQNKDTEVYRQARFRMDLAGWVHLEGVVKDGSGSIWTMPAKYYPKYQTELVAADLSSTSVRLSIMTNGNIIPNQMTPTIGTSLDGLRYRADVRI